MLNIRAAMPLLARHAGEWTGNYILIDQAGVVTDRYTSHLSCLFPEDGDYPYYQINRYQWPDGRQEEHHFPATYQDQKIWFNTERIQGYAWEVDDTTILLRYGLKALPETSTVEIILLSPRNDHRAHTSHWFKNQQLYQRTLMQEERLH